MSPQPFQRTVAERMPDVRFCVDLSATPFYLHGSGYSEGSPFPWLVSDFGLVDAIESGIVKIPRIPVSSSTGRPEPEFFALWKHIQSRLQPGERLPGGKPKPDAVWREAQAALLTLASQWKQRFDQIAGAKPGQEKVPPVLIIVGDNTDIAELFYRNISGEESIEIASPDDDEEEDSPPSARKKAKAKTVFGNGQLFPEHFSNREGFRPTLRIDSKLLAHPPLFSSPSLSPSVTANHTPQRVRHGSIAAAFDSRRCFDSPGNERRATGQASHTLPTAGSRFSRCAVSLRNAPPWAPIWFWRRFPQRRRGNAAARTTGANRSGLKRAWDYVWDYSGTFARTELA